MIVNDVRIHNFAGKMIMIMIMIMVMVMIMITIMIKIMAMIIPYLSTQWAAVMT